MPNLARTQLLWKHLTRQRSAPKAAVSGWLMLQPEPAAALAGSEGLSPGSSSLWKLGNDNLKVCVQHTQESQGFVSACPPCQKKSLLLFRELVGKCI